MDLKGKIVVVSGATSGIGRAAALKLASQGAEVLAIGRDAQLNTAWNTKNSSVASTSMPPTGCISTASARAAARLREGSV